MYNRMIAIILFLAFVSAPLSAQQGVTVRVKDITDYRLTSVGTVLGEGLVVGLKGTGDKSDRRAQEMARALAQAFRNDANPDEESEKFTDEDFSAANIARVSVQASINENTTVAGSHITCTVSAVGNTKSLAGGVLLPTFMKASPTDEVIVAEASGLLRISKTTEGGGGGAGGATVATARALLTMDINVPFFEEVKDQATGETVSKHMVLILRNADANTARNIARNINHDREILGLAGTNEGESETATEVAKSIGPGRIDINVPSKWWGSEMEFRAIVDNVSVDPDLAAAVTVNRASGTIAMTGNVRVMPGAITVKGVTITTQQSGDLPEKLAGGTEATDPVVPLSKPKNTNFKQLLDTFNMLQLNTDEMIEVLYALQRNNMLLGSLTVIE